MPYVVTDTVVSLRSVSAGVALAQAGLPYYLTVWPQTRLGVRPQCGPARPGVHLHNSGRGRSAALSTTRLFIHGLTAPPSSVYSVVVCRRPCRANSNRQFQSHGKLTNRRLGLGTARDDDKIRVDQIGTVGLCQVGVGPCATTSRDG